MFYVYQITNNINGMIYVGVHKSTNPNDSYMGSGVHIKRAIAKYGVHNFTKTILFEYETAEDAYKKESEIVNEDFIQRSDTYNLTLGGAGGFYHIDQSGENNPMKNPVVVEKVRFGLLKTRQNNKEYYDDVSRQNIAKYNNANIDKSHSKETKVKISERLKEYYRTHGHNCTGVKLSDDVRQRISDGWTPEKKELQRQRMLARIAQNPDCVKTNLGRKMSDDTKEKMRLAAMKRWEKNKSNIVSCPHCGKTGVAQTLKRWHFDRCRLKEK